MGELLSSPLLDHRAHSPSHRSLKRPGELLKARAAFEKGDISREDLSKEEDKAIRDIVKLQQDVGIDSITDGEFSRHMFYDVSCALPLR